ncbi:Cyclic peptide transporter [Nitrospira sp. KM1]|uniref:cyclic peptide export ABC transporter n=1 Tax=Nitrospira sp. KM1 TaxID=1936990 RepID=UPI0013A78E75|nr:cyclic peptide export ABC transporter [Nitrospira sp. KM1]BCA53184.1 Cyclic peptide transporter [Nitrospira sp. KM1]
MKIHIPAFLAFLFSRSRTMMTAMIGVGLISGLCSAGVLALINRSLQGGRDPEGWLVLGFVAIVAGKLTSQVASHIMLTRFAQDTTLELSLTLCDKLLKAPYQQTESLGPARIFVMLSDDVSMLAWSIQCLPQLAMNSAIVAGCGIYLAWLSWQTFLLVVAATISGAAGYHWLHTRAFSAIFASREARTQLFKHFRSLTDGLKELLMHQGRRGEFVHHEIREAAERYRRTSMQGAQQYALAEAWSHLAFYAMIGTILFMFPHFLALSPESLIGYVVVLLYMMAPIWGIIGSLPTIEKGQAAFDNIKRLGLMMDQQSTESDVLPLQQTPKRTSVAFRDVVFTYPQDEKRTQAFSLGPINLELHAGEVVFVIGGNGSGKSTFVKVLAGLYVPTRGTISLAGTPVGTANRTWYREHFSIVFSDYYLFEKLLGLEEAAISTAARSYLTRLEIDHVVSVQDRAFSTVNVSQGQRKRLALATAYLENRPVYVFDEWAADQDPQYKEVFYKQVLPDLRTRGKIVVVITHDDRYFHLGDRVIKLEDGTVTEQHRPPASLLHAGGDGR